MTDYWFTDREREQLCVNPRCEEHGDGSELCDIPSEEPDNVFSLDSSMLGGFDAEPLRPTVEVVRSDGGSE